jgi:hypothetical protein
MTILDTTKNVLYKNLWGQHSLNIGEAIAFIIAFAIMYFGWLGKWSFWIGIAIIIIATAVF